MKIPMFKVIQIETQHGCNYNCICCPNQNISPTWQKMKWSLFTKIINQLKDFEGRISPYLMNESLLDDRIVNIIKYIKKTAPNAYVRINTNASMLKGKLAKELAKSGLDGMEVSVHAVKDNEYKEVHGTDVPLKQIQDNVLNFRKIFNGQMSIYVVSGLSSSSIEDFREFFGNISVGFAPRINRGGNLPGKRFVTKPKICPEVLRQMYIRHTGKVVPCCNDYRNTVILGDCNQQTLKQIWSGEKYNMLRVKLEENINLPNICKECDGPY